MGDDNVDTLSGSISTDEEYIEKLAKYLKGSIERDENGSIEQNSQFANYAGTIGHFASRYLIYTFATGDAFGVSYDVSKKDKQNARDSYKGSVANIMYDINGFGNKPDRAGKDMFYFIVDDNGTVIPYGSKQYINAYNEGIHHLWKYSNNRCNETGVASGYACTGSIADNGWKVIYE